LLILAVALALEVAVGLTMVAVHHRLQINELSANPDQPWIIGSIGFTAFVSCQIPSK
jgi:hypothetical protein